MMFAGADSTYQFIRPYKWVMKDVLVLDVEGNPLKDEEGTLTGQTRQVRTKVFITPTFNEDGSLDELFEV
jgi:hypothetical protein